VSPEDRTGQVHASMPFAALLGVEAVTGTAEEIRARLAWDAGRCTSGGVLHGGALMGLADTVGGLVAFLNLPEGSAGTTTIESKTNFFRGVSEGVVEAVGRPLHAGRTTIVVDTDLFDGRGKRVARVTQTQAVLWPRA
jgi:1,4-dihydroxy-2-naphthoyl-CoA hydrolase